MTKPKPQIGIGQIEIGMSGGPSLEISSYNDMNTAIHLLYLIGKARHGKPITLEDINQVRPEDRHHLVKAICLHKAKQGKS